MKLTDVISNLENRFKLHSNEQLRLCLRELVYMVLIEHHNKYREKLGDRVDWNNLRQELYSTAYDSLYEKTLRIVPYANDLCEVFVGCLEEDVKCNDVFSAIFIELDKMAEYNG